MFSYASDIYYELNQKFDEEVESLIQPLKERISGEELDELRALMYSASCEVINRGCPKDITRLAYGSAEIRGIE